MSTAHERSIPWHQQPGDVKSSSQSTRRAQRRRAAGQAVAAARRSLERQLQRRGRRARRRVGDPGPCGVLRCARMLACRRLPLLRVCCLLVNPGSLAVG